MNPNFYLAPELKKLKSNIEQNKHIKRHSWDTCIKHYYRLGLEENIPFELRKHIPSTNISRWKQEAENKYVGCEVAEFINQEIDLIKRFNQSSKIKKIYKSYIMLCDAFNYIITDVKGIKSAVKNQKDIIVNAIESIKGSIPINQALKVFNLSRATYQNYKTIVIHKCEPSYFKWCTKRFPNQLLTNEVLTIKTYMEHDVYKFWSKSSIYLKAVRDASLSCSLTTFYNYCRLLGFGNLKKQLKPKYKPLVTSKPNEVWCADVTIFKTTDGMKHYIHILMDHFSKKILGYCIEKNSSGKAIRVLLKNAFLKYKPINTLFLTDGGPENVNDNVASLITSYNDTIVHRIAQRDVLFSNSMIEAFNRVLKYQFLYPKNIGSKKQLENMLAEAITIYNTNKPQLNLGGNTPCETFVGRPINLSNYTIGFKSQQRVRIAQNKSNSCKKCL